MVLLEEKYDKMGAGSYNFYFDNGKLWYDYTKFFDETIFLT